MKTVSIFIASSMMEFRRERAELSEFLDMLNNVYKNSGIHFLWNRPETMSKQLLPHGSQRLLEDEIRNSQFFILIVGQHLGERTYEEFQLALRQFEKSGTPLIFPFFYTKPNDFPSDEMVAFRKYLSTELKQYTYVYSDFDTIKLQIQFELLRSGAFMENMEAIASEEAVADKGLSTVRSLILEQQQKITELKAQPTTQKTIANMAIAYAEIGRLVHTYKVMPSALLDYIAFLCDQHLYDEAITLGHWLENFYQLENPGGSTWAVLKNQLGVCYMESNRYKLGEQYFREALEIYRRLAVENPVDFEPYVALTCNHLGHLLSHVNHMEEAECYLREALEIQLRLMATNPAAFEPNVALTCNNLGHLLSDTNRLNEAEQLFRKALEIYRHLESGNPSAFEPYIAMACNSLGRLLCDINQMDEAERYFREALEIYRHLAKVNPSAYEPDVATTCNNLGNLMWSTHETEKAEQYFREALEIHRRLAEANPSAYEPDVATTCNNLGILLFNTNRIAEAEYCYQETLEVFRRLATQNPAAYEQDVAAICYNLGLLKRENGDIAQARHYLDEALALFEKFPHLGKSAQTVRDTLSSL